MQDYKNTSQFTAASFGKKGTKQRENCPVIKALNIEFYN